MEFDFPLRTGTGLGRSVLGWQWQLRLGVGRGEVEPDRLETGRVDGQRPQVGSGYAGIHLD